MAFILLIFYIVTLCCFIAEEIFKDLISSCRDRLPEILQMLGNMSNPQVELMTRTMKKWAKENKVPL